MEVFKIILTNYGPSIASICVMIYLCFFVKKAVNGNEKKLKDDLSTVLRENAEMKVQLKKYNELLIEYKEIANEKIDDLTEQVDGLIKESEKNERDNKKFED